MADDASRIIGEMWQSMGEIAKFVEEELASLDYWERSDLAGQVILAGRRIATACDKYAAEHDHQPEWVKKKAQDAARSYLTRALEEGMGGYFG